MTLPPNKLPFELPRIPKPQAGVPGRGHSVATTVQGTTVPTEMTVGCWLPEDVSVENFVALTAMADWSKVYSKLRRSRLVDSAAFRRPLTKEMKQLQFEVLGTASNTSVVRTSSAPVAVRNSTPTCTVVAAASKGPLRPSLNAGPVFVSCKCAVEEYEFWRWDEENGWYPVGTATVITCVFEYRQGGSQPIAMTTAAHATGSANPYPIIANLSLELCGSFDCDSGNSSQDLTVSMSGSTAYAEGSGETVMFQVSPSDAGQIASVDWNWTREYGDTQTTTSGFCPITFDQPNCSLPVHNDGYLTFTANTHSGGSAQAHWRVAVDADDPSAPPADFVEVSQNPSLWPQEQPFGCRTKQTPAKPKCPSADKIVRDPVFQHMSDSLWKLTANTKKEHGAWLFYDKDGSIRFGKIHVGNDSTIPDMAGPLNTVVPPGAIGMIHTHVSDNFVSPTGAVGGNSGYDAMFAKYGQLYAVLVTFDKVYAILPDMSGQKVYWRR